SSPAPRGPGPGPAPRSRSLPPSSGSLTPRELRPRVLLLRGLDHVLRQTRGQADRAGGLLTRLHVRSGHVDDAVGVDLEGHLDAHLAAIADAEPGELELAEQLALGRLVRFALVDLDLHLLLAVAVGGVRLAALDRDGGV